MFGGSQPSTTATAFSSMREHGVIALQNVRAREAGDRAIYELLLVKSERFRKALAELKSGNESMNKLPMRFCCVLLLLLIGCCGHVLGQKVNKVDFAKKIAEATPPKLPQTPVEKRGGTDAGDKNLKGKVKSVAAYFIENSKKQVSEENYYDENGNLTIAINYDDGYPDSVTVYGYLDGMRVLRSNDVTYAPGEKPPPKEFEITQRAEDNKLNPNASADTRYQIRNVHKYDLQNRLIEEQVYQNNGEIWSRHTYSYEGNRRVERDYDNRGQEISKTTYILDQAGNAIEEDMYDEKDKVSDVNIMTRDFDHHGNWVVERTFEETTVKGKKIRKPSWTLYRTITYYP